MTNKQIVLNVIKGCVIAALLILFAVAVVGPARSF